MGALSVTISYLCTAKKKACINGRTVQKAEKGGNKQEDNAAAKPDSAVSWIVIGLVVAVLIASGVIAVSVIKKKKQTPPATV